MSRRGRREHRGQTPAAAPSRAGRRRAGFPGRLLWAAPALLVAGMFLWGPVHRLATRPGAQPAGPPESDALAGMSSADALRAGLALGRAGRDPESLPYYRHAIRQARVDMWQTHYNYATALYNSTLRIELRNGLPSYAVRSSWERIALVREAVHQLTLADGLARTPQDRATVRAAYGQMTWLWGMPWDAFVAYRQAYSADPANRALAQRGDGLMDLLRTPSARGTVGPDARGAGPR
jgi:hypothetical protein